IAPGPLIVTPRRVEDSPFTLRAHPGPGFLRLTLYAILQYGAIPGIMLGVHVGLVPALEAAEAFHDGVAGVGNRGPEYAGAVAKKLRTHQVDILRRIEKAVGCAMQRNETPACLDEIKQGLFLLGADSGGVGI